ncbi:unnamed protein product, partial [Musa acuminata var. zebrina]
WQRDGDCPPKPAVKTHSNLPHASIGPILPTKDAFKPSARTNARFPKKSPPLLHVLVSSDSCRGGTGFKGSSDAFGEVDAFRALHIVSLLHVKEVLGICLRICGVFYSR